jgi:hypothetical protein
MPKIFHQSKNIASSYQEKATANKCLMKMDNYFTLLIVRCHLLATCSLGSTILYRELDIFDDTPIVCGCSKCKGLKKNLQRVALIHYIND